MANPEHLKVLKKGVKAWNAWRKMNAQEHIDLSNRNLSDRDFSRANFSHAYLGDADLCGVNFTNADLIGANLSHAKLWGANLSHADLKGANLYFADLFEADIRNADLNGTNLWRANLEDANLEDTDLRDAFLFMANLVDANLKGANLSRAEALGVNFNRAILEKCKFNKAIIGWTTFDNLDLRDVIGLENVIHRAPSTVGIDTIYKSQGVIPDNFLEDAGVPEEIIDIARSIRNGPPIQWHSCCISYSTKDEEFVQRLHSRMREANMRVWCAAKDLKGGRKLHEQVFEAIQTHDRLLIVLSEHSIQSEWVMTEIRKARETEKKEKRRKLFPIRLTDFETLRDWTCFDADTGKDLAVEVREYFIPDFSNWKVLADGHPAAFESAFARLKKDLEAENSKKP